MNTRLAAFVLLTAASVTLAQDQAAPVQANNPPQATTPASQPSSNAQASKKYFSQVCEVLDRALTQPAAKAVPSFYSNSANKITTLSKENVDPDVVAWGGTVAMALTNAANALDVGKQRAEGRADSVATPGAYDANDPNRNARARVDVQNAQQARRQAGVEERANASEQVANLLANLQDSRTKVAAQLTQRYGNP